MITTKNKNYLRLAILFFLFISFFTSGNSQESSNIPPDIPVPVEPADQATGVSTAPLLSVQVSDPESQELSVTFYGRRKLSDADDFTIIGLPDTQYYTGEKYEGTPAIFYSQTQWITDNKALDNIVFVSQLGDCVENGDAVEDEWKIADTAMKKIEDPLTTLLEDGIPYGIAVGNHDQSPFGNAAGTTALYNAYFGESRFSGRNYYGGFYGSNYDNHYELFSAGGMDFIVIHLEYDPNSNTDVLDWADDVLTSHADRRAIIVSHFLIIFGNPGPFGPQGQAIYNQFKDNTNVFLMLCGHVSGEGRRTDTYNGHSIHTVLADYQNRPEGGTGWLRIMRFSPVANTISIKTYSPWLDTWETDDDSEFTLPYDMEDAGFQQIGEVTGIPSGTLATTEWPGLDPNTEYEWYAVVNDGTDQTTGPEWSFTTGDHRLNITVNLEGSMEEGLSGLVPLAQPYSQPPWNYGGTESILSVSPGTVDWVLVELREAPEAASATGGTIIHRFAALLKTSGEIVSAEEELPAFPNAISQNLFVVVRHRNHLDIMSAEGLQNQGGLFTYDFTPEAAKTYGGAAGAKLLPSGLWGMIAGDGLADGVIDSMDKSAWISGAGRQGYLADDLDLNLQVDQRDKNDLWYSNLGYEAQVPE